MKKLFVGLIVLGLTIQAFAQIKTEKLSEVEILSVNYKYLNDVGASEFALPVKILERKVATFDLKDADFYEDEEMEYNVYFEIPKGKILAVYNGEGEIIRTSERFKNISLPLDVSRSIFTEYPGWKIINDVYLVTYHKNNGAKKMFKLLLEKDNKRKRVKTDYAGNFI